MEIFREGSDPPHPYFEAQFNFGHKKGKKTKLPQNTQNG